MKDKRLSHFKYCEAQPKTAKQK